MFVDKGRITVCGGRGGDGGSERGRVCRHGGGQQSVQNGGKRRRETQ